MENAICQVLFELIESWLVTLSYTLQYVLKTNKGHCKKACCSRDNTFCFVTILVVAFAKCQRKKKNLPTSPVLVPMFIKPFQLLRREFPLQALLVPTFLLKSLLFFCLDIFEPQTCRVSNSEREIAFIGWRELEMASCRSH